MIRIIAFISMFIDHIGVVFFPDIIVFRIIGRLAFPLFAWGIARGYLYTTNFLKYAIRLFVIAVISQLPYFLLFKSYNLNVCFTLFIGLLILKLYNINCFSWLKWFSIFLLIFLSYYLKMEYNIYGILMILIFFIFWDNNYFIFYQAALTLICTFLFMYHPIQLFAIFSSVLILFFNRFDFKLNRYIQYGFYPLHLLIIFIIKKGWIL